MTITGDKAEYQRYLLAKKKEGRELSATEQQWLKYEAAMAEKRLREAGERP